MRKVEQAVIGTITAGFLILAVFTLKGALGWIGRPFPGFLFFKSAIISPFWISGWSGPDGPGLRYHDVILRVNGSEVGSGDDLRALLHGARAGEALVTDVSRWGVGHRGESRVEVFTAKDLLLTFGVIFPAGIIAFLVGMMVYIFRPYSLEGRTFFAMGALLGMYCMTVFDFCTEYRFYPLLLLCAGLLPASSFTLAMVFPEVRPWVRKRPWSLPCVYLLFLPLAGLFYAGVLWDRTLHLAADVISFGTGTIGILGVFVSALHSFIGSSSPAARERARFLAWGLALVAGCALPGVVLLWRGFGAGMIFFFFGILIFFSSVGYGIAHYDLYTVDVMVKRVTGYILSTGALVAASFLFMTALGWGLLWATGRSTPFSALLAALLAAAFFNPVRRRVQALVDRSFFREKYEYARAFESFGQIIFSPKEAAGILEQFLSSVLGMMHIEGGAVLTLRDAEGRYRTAHAAGSGMSAQIVLEPSSGIVRRLTSGGKEIAVPDTEGAPADLREWGAHLFFPMYAGKTMMGICALGKKSSGDAYTGEDREILRAFIGQLTLALGIASLREKGIVQERIDLEMKAAQEVQAGLAPPPDLRLPGLDISGACLTGGGMGSEYFDIIHAAPQRIGISLADAAGRGLSAALLLSMVKGACHAGGDLSSRPGPLIQRLNRVVSGIRGEERSAGRRSFLAFLYGYVDLDTGALTISRAGIPFPCLYRVSNGTIELLRTSGMMMGVFPDVPPAEERVSFAPGDVLLLYTKGLVESGNDDGEPFGYERLEKAIRDSVHTPAPAIKDHILGSLHSHLGRRPGRGPRDPEVTFVVAKRC